MADSIPRYDVSSRRGLTRRLRSWRLLLAVGVAVAAVAVLVGPIVVGVRRVATGQGTIHRLERMARDAQPPSTSVFDSGVKDDKGSVGFAYGTSRDPAGLLLDAQPPAPWERWRDGGETATTRYYRHARLILTVRVTPCRLTRCAAGDQLVYTEVQDVS